jgi:hypothetical protein
MVSQSLTLPITILTRALPFSINSIFRQLNTPPPAAQLIFSAYSLCEIVAVSENRFHLSAFLENFDFSSFMLTLAAFKNT